MKAVPGRPRGFDEALVLDRAVDLFWRSGYRSTTTRDLEAALGVRQSSLYNAFGSKQGLMDAALDRYEARTSAALLVPLEAGGSGLDDIDTFFDALARWVTEDGRGGCMIINLMAEEGGVKPATSARTTAYLQRVRGALRGAIARAVDAGATMPDVIEPRTSVLFGAVLGMNILARGGASYDEVARIADGAHHLVESWRT